MKKTSWKKLNRWRYFALFALAAIGLVILLVPESTKAVDIEPAWSVLKNTETGFGAQIKNIWTKLIQVSNGLLIAILLVVAFSQILRININTYGVKKILPALILAILAANFSFLFCRIMVDLANITITIFIDQKQGVLQIVDPEAFSASTLGVKEAIDGGEAKWGVVLWFIVAQLLLFVAGVAALILAFLFFIRLWMIYFLVGIAPIAFIAMALPQTKTYFNQWWSNFAKWTFMPVASVFWIWVGNSWMGTIKSAGGEASIVLTFLFGGLCYYLAITTPFKLGGAVMSAWGGIGKKISSPLVDNAKQQGRLWWSGQAASGNKLNPLGHIARVPMNMAQRKEHIEKRIKDNWDDKASANIMQSRSGRKRTVEQERMGGDLELAKQRVLRDYLKSDKGQGWAKGRAEYQQDLKLAKDAVETGFKGGISEYRNSEEGEAAARENLMITKQGELFDLLVKNADQQMLSNFQLGKGQFEDDKKASLLIQDYAVATAMSRTMDEAVKNSLDRKVIDVVLNDQVATQNIASEYNRSIDRLKQFEAEEEEKEALLAKRDSDMATDIERERLNVLLRSERTREREGGIAGEKEKQRTLKESADRLVKSRADEGQHHLDGMNDLGDDGKMLGFTKIAGNSDLGFLMTTRAGKLMSMELESDADKLLKANTPQEIAMQMINGSYRFNTTHLENFRNGRRELNDPAANRGIESGMLALAKIARQSNNPDASVARESFVAMLNDDAAISAAGRFNERMDKHREGKGKIEMPSASEIAGMDPSQKAAFAKKIRNEVELKLGTTGPGGRDMFSIVSSVPTMGLSDNPSAYLSGGATRQTVNVEQRYAPPTLSSAQNGVMLQNYAVTGMRTGGNYGQVINSLGRIPNAPQVASDMKVQMQFEQNHMVSALGKAMGLSFSDPSVKKAFKQILSGIPSGANTGDIVKALNTKAQELGGTPISNNTKIIVERGKDQTQEIDIRGLVTRAKGAEAGIKAASMVELKPMIDKLTVDMEHFASVPENTAREQSKILNDAADKMKSATDQDAIISIVHEAMQKVGMAGSVPPSNATTARERLIDIAQAGKFATQGYENGQFKLDKAQHAAAEGILGEKERLEEEEAAG